MTRTTISYTREGMELIREAANAKAPASRSSSRSRPDRAAMAADDNPYPMRALAAQLRAIGDQGYALADKALKVSEARDTPEAVMPYKTATSFTTA